MGNKKEHQLFFIFLISIQSVEMSAKIYPNTPAKEHINNEVISFKKMTFNGFFKSITIIDIHNTDNIGFMNVLIYDSLMLVYLITALISRIIIIKYARVEPIIAPEILKIGIGMRTTFAVSFTIIPISEYKNGSNILPIECSVIINIFVIHINTSAGDNIVRRCAEAVFLNNRFNISLEKREIINAQGSIIITVIWSDDRIVFLARFIFFVANAPLITGKMLAVSAEIIPIGRLNIVKAYPEYAPYNHLAPSIVILRVSFK